MQIINNIIKAKRLLNILCALGLAFVLTACATTAGRTPLPLELTSEAKIPGVPEARFWGDEWPKYSREIFDSYTEKDFLRYFPALYNTPHSYLAISGGGANGAFGAGLLSGWTAAGTRPEFAMVTGISTGALTAPFAFLGSEYDTTMKTLYTTISTKDIVVKRKPIKAVFSDSMADSAPLRKLIASYINNEIVEEIAHEHRRGRRLFVSTVNLDASRSVIWNIGAIADSEYPQKQALIHEILLASASIPVAFPPVLIKVEANGQPYDEMHVDGGTGSQVFVYPAASNWRKITEKLKVQGTPQIYVIRNAFLEPDYRGVNRTLLPIASRSIDSLIRTQGLGDLYQIFALSKRDGNDFNLAYIPADFTEEPEEGFDPVYMTKLFERGYEMAVKGYPWKKEPPGFTPFQD